MCRALFSLESFNVVVECLAGGLLKLDHEILHYELY